MLTKLLLYLLDHLDTIVLTLIVSVGGLWVFIKWYGKTHIEERVRQSNRHKFSLADEQRKAIYKLHDLLANYLHTANAMMINPKLTNINTFTDHALPMMFEPFQEIRIALERMDLLFEGKTAHRDAALALSNKLDDMQHDAVTYLSKYHLEQDRGKKEELFTKALDTLGEKWKEVRDNEMIAVRKVMSKYIKEISR